MKYLFAASFFIFSFSQAVSSKVDIAKRVIDGANANINQFPYHTIIRRDDGVICGGGLFDPKWVITAAVCFIDAEDIELIFGAETLDQDDDNVKTMGYASIHIHPDFDAVTFENNIAIIELSEAIEETKYIKPWPLQPSSHADMDLEGEYLTLAGFGSKTTDSNENNNDINFGPLFGMDNKDCKISSYKIVDTMLCGKPLKKKYNHAVCADDGSPVTTRVNGEYSLVGIAILSDTGCKPPSVFTRIAPYLDWISETTGKEF